MKSADYKKIKPLVKPEEIFNLTGKVGVIVGGAGKMGRQFAEVLAQAGARVVIADLNNKAINEALKTLSPDVKSKVVGFKCDVLKSDDIKKLFLFIRQHFGRLDFLINNTMGKPDDYYQTFENYSLDSWKKVLDVNLTGPFLACREAIALMKKTGGGSIVMTASIYGVVGPDQRIYKDCAKSKNPYDSSFPLNAPGVYSASKGGLISFSKYLATLLAPDNIRINVLTPGGVFDGQEEAFHEAYTARTPLGRMATWTDFNGAVLFLVSDASRYMTGSNLMIDGGWTAW